MADLNQIAKDNYELGFKDAIKIVEKHLKIDLSFAKNKMDIENAPKRYGSGVWDDEW